MPPPAGAGVRLDGTVAAQVTLPSPFGAAEVAVTVEGWWRHDGLDIAGENFSTLFGIAGGRRLITTNGGVGQLSWGAITDNTFGASFAYGLRRWQHIAAVFTPATVSLYVDGVLADTTAGIATYDFSGTFRLGAYGTSNYAWRGAIAGVRLWQRALTADEVARRARGLEVGRAGLLADLPMDVGQGVKVFDRSDVPLFDGTLTGGAQWVQPKAARGTLFAEGGSSPVVTVPKVSDVFLARNPWTVLSWMRTGPHGNVSRWWDAYNGAIGARAYKSSDTSITITRGDGATLQSVGIILPASPVEAHAAATYDGTTLRAVLNGVQVDSIGSTASPAAPGTLGIGNIAGGALGWTSRLWDFAVFSRALSVVEIRAIMLGQVDPNDMPGCVAWFPLDGDTLNRAPVGMRKRNIIEAAGSEFATQPTTYAQNNNVVIPVPLDYASRAGRIQALGAAGNMGVYWPNGAAAPVPNDGVVVGERWTVSADVATGDGTDGLPVSAQLWFTDAANTLIGSPVTGAAVVLSALGWQRISATLTAPIGATRVRFAINVNAAVVAGNFAKFRNVTLRRGASTVHVSPSELEPAAAMHGTPANAPRLVRPRARGGLRFVVPNNSGYVNLPLSAALATPGLAPYSFAAWIRPAWNPTVTTLRVGGRYSANGRAEMYLGGSALSFRRIGGGIDALASTTLTPLLGGWRLAVGTYDGVNIRLYVDGLLVATTAHAGSWAAEALTDHVLGNASVGGTATWSDAIADAREWTRALTDDEVAGLLIGSVPRFGLIGEWLTEGSIQGGVALDTSPAPQYHGTIVGAVAA